MFGGKTLFNLKYENMSFHSELQIIHADVTLEIDNQILIDEPLCIDVGLPALLCSTYENTGPVAIATSEEWDKLPFLVCGCGDPECRGYFFKVKHTQTQMVKWTELELTGDGNLREMGEYEIPLTEYRSQIFYIGIQFIDFVEHLNYQPYYKNTVQTAKKWVDRIANPL
jgi:hypothetical protein